MALNESPNEEVAVQPEVQSRKFFWWTRPGTSKTEVALVRKIDLCLLTYCCLSFFCKDLDRNNVSNAYVSGMKEDLGLNANELNWFTTYYNIGYILGQIPSNILLTKISPRYYLPGAEFVWSIMVLLLYKVNSAKQIYALRFFIGLVEATCWPGLHFMIGSWYRNHEVNKRSGIFTAAGISATMFSGYIQAGIYTTLDGRLSLPGWRWLFIIDFVISLPLCAFGLIFIPNPITAKVRSWWMTEADKDLAIKRLAADERAPLGKFNLTIFKRVFGRWRFWIMNIMFSFYYFTYQAPTTSTMALWLKAEKTYTVPQINNLPTVYSAISIVYMLGSGVFNDWSGTRLPSLILIGICNIIAESILVAWFVPTGAKYFAFWIAGTIQAMIPIVVSWTHEVCSRDAEERAIVVASLNSIGAAQGTWWNQVFVKTTDAPRFYKGYRAGLVVSIVMTCWIPVVELFDRRQKKMEKKEKLVIEGSAGDARSEEVQSTEGMEEVKVPLGKSSGYGT